MYEGKRGKKHRRRGHRGVCTYCGKSHTKGKTRGDSCRGRGNNFQFAARQKVA